MPPTRVLVLEAFYGGSHKQLIDFLFTIIKEHNDDVAIDNVVMTDKKWHWRMRTSALYFAEKIPKAHSYKTLFTSSVTNLAELLGLRPDLLSAHKILYFHENQLVYPVRKQQERDFQFGYNQIMSCMVADVILFNSIYNMTSFLNGIQSFINVMPDYRRKDLAEKISPKCQVLYFPLQEKEEVREMSVKDTNRPLHIVWPHRWEHDKNPADFFDVLFKLQDEGLAFNLSVIGQTYTDVPAIFDEAKVKLCSHILHWGYQQTREDYLNVIHHADVVVSTANHEFFGVSMLEAVAFGCYPLCPNRLVYPEIFPSDNLYNTNQQLFKRLKNLCQRPQNIRSNRTQIDISRFYANHLKGEYLRNLLPT